MSAAGRLDWKYADGWRHGPTFHSSQLEAVLDRAQALGFAADIRAMRIVATPPDGSKAFTAWTWSIGDGWKKAN